MFQITKNCFKKVGDIWAVAIVERACSGQDVTISLANGGTKRVTLAECIGSVGGAALFKVAAKPELPKAEVGDLGRILKLFDTARARLKFPAITLGLSADDPRGVRISVAGERARFPGTLNVTSSEKNVDNRRDFFGRVTLDGKFEPRDGAPHQLPDFLRKFAADPVAVAQEHGKLTGYCCFCDRRLTDERSTGVGYGSTCAKNYGMPWGSRPESFADAA